MAARGRQLAILVEAAIKRRDSAATLNSLAETKRVFKDIKWTDRKQIIFSLTRMGKGVVDERVIDELIGMTAESLKKSGLIVMQPSHWSQLLWAITKHGNEMNCYKLSQIGCEEFNRISQTTTLSSAVTGTLSYVAKETGNILFMDSIIRYILRFANDHFLTSRYKPREVCNVLFAASELQVWNQRMISFVEKYIRDNNTQRNLLVSDITMLLHSVVSLGYEASGTHVVRSCQTLIHERMEREPLPLDLLPGLLVSFSKGRLVVNNLFDYYGNAASEVQTAADPSDVAIVCSALTVSGLSPPSALRKIIQSLLHEAATSKTAHITNRHLAVMLTSVYNRSERLKLIDRSILRSAVKIISQVGWGEGRDAVDLFAAFGVARYHESSLSRTLEEHYYRGMLPLTNEEVVNLVQSYRVLSYDTSIWTENLDFRLAIEMTPTHWSDTIKNLQRNHPLGPKPEKGLKRSEKRPSRI
eukprot:TRINITY_DN37683_c0_g1_i1.p1 TRINITY_DN37683_c0_g1~~TRINITY_DN37683_c0_g1_i1.p1  ORF type:complete len:471 (+),score=52.45 TRINITY_DN37683_c0_g1_i1:93-1505(+)